MGDVLQPLVKSLLQQRFLPFYLLLLRFLDLHALTAAIARGTLAHGTDSQRSRSGPWRPPLP